MKKFLLILAIFGNVQADNGAQSKCVGKFANPISDICWSCLFPITIGGVKVSPNNEDTPNPRKIICKCPAPPPIVWRIGIPISFWEPVRLIDVTRIKFCLVSIGGVKIGPNSIKGHGSVSSGETTSNSRHSFYQVHYYIYPVMYWLELLTDFVCMERSTFDVAYITEFDPLWNDDETAFVLNPEAVLFANPIAQAACAVDAVKATSGFPLDSMFWCSGCQGSMYPFTGHVVNHVGGVQASLLLVSRMLAKMHREGFGQITSGESEAVICEKSAYSPIIKKTQYKQQMLYPVPTTGKGGCRPLGRTSVTWEGGKEKPYNGEDFGYLIWRKRNCCMF